MSNSIEIIAVLIIVLVLIIIIKMIIMLVIAQGIPKAAAAKGAETASPAIVGRVPSQPRGLGFRDPSLPSKGL